MVHLGRISLPLVLAVLAAGCSGGDDATGSGGGERPRVARNVILFVVDTLRADRMSCYGYERETSPRIDAFAAGGALYRNNYAQGCWTVPSMISMMSGLYVFDEEQTLPDARPTLAELLKRGGIVTAGFAGNVVLVHDRGFQRGFDHFEGAQGDGRATTVVDRFLNWYEGAKDELADGPGFFAWVHPTDPHSEYSPDEQYRKWFGQERLDEDELVPLWRAEIDRAREHLLPGQETILSSLIGMREYSNMYDGEVLAVDDAFGRMLDRLAADGILDETLIIFASDHGELLFEHHHYPQEISMKIRQNGGFPHAMQDLFAIGHRAWFQEELWNTPLIVAGPGVPPGIVDDRLRANLDIFPTVLNAFGLQAPPWIEGESLLDDDDGHERVFSFGFGTSAVVEDTGLKLILHTRDRFLLDPDAPQPTELFDLKSDPEERRNLSAEVPDEAARLADEIRAWHDRVKRPFETDFTPRAHQALKDMGYVGDD